MKCYQTRNVFGYPLSTKLMPMTNCGVFHNTETMHTDCQAVPDQCDHHEPIYDEFTGWVEEIRREAGV